MSTGSEEHDTPPARGQWALARRRLKRDRVALACGIFLVLLVVAVGPRAKGASELRVIRAHALRNAVAPLVTMLAVDAGMAIGIAMYVETVFGLPGLGRTLIRSEAGLHGYDLPVILAVTLVAGAAIIILNLVADLVVMALDPTLAQSRRRNLLRPAGRTA